MDDTSQPQPKVALVWRGDAEARASATSTNNRLSAIFAALSAEGFAPEPCVFDEAVTDEVRAQLAGVDAALAWVNPLVDGRGRDALNDLMREAERAGVMVSARPDVIARMGVKSVLYRTRDLSWGCDVRLYETPQALAAGFPASVAAGPRVLKRERGNDGQGVWKVETTAGGWVRVHEARRDSPVETMALGDFMGARAGDFCDGGLVDQPFQPRHLDGMIRCYMAGGQLVGFGHQYVRALAEPQDGPASPRLYSGPDDPRFQRLRRLMEDEWTPGLCQRLDLAADDLPVIWDADLLLGPRDAAGEDSYVLCEINASAVFPIPDEAPSAIARLLRERFAARATSTPAE